MQVLCYDIGMNNAELYRPVPYNAKEKRKCGGKCGQLKDYSEFTYYALTNDYCTVCKECKKAWLTQTSFDVEDDLEFDEKDFKKFAKKFEK